MLGVALIGAGNVGHIRARVIHASSNAQVRVVADVDAAQAHKLASSIAADATTDCRLRLNPATSIW